MRRTALLAVLLACILPHSHAGGGHDHGAEGEAQGLLAPHNAAAIARVAAASSLRPPPWCPPMPSDAGDCGAEVEDYNLSLAVGSVFILLGVSLLGSLSPLLLSLFKGSQSWAVWVIKVGYVARALFP